MSNVAIVTDSTCCLPADLVRQYNIHILPMVINYRGKSYHDGIDITPTEIYHIMRLKGDLPTTSTISPGNIIRTFLDCGEKTSNILCITLTSLQSKTYETAMISREMVMEQMPHLNIEVMDSRSVGGALGFITLEAAREASRGGSLESALKRAKEIHQKVQFLAMLDTLYYLARTGRLALAAHWAASLLQLKPILEHRPERGVTEPVTRPRTTAKALETLKELIKSRVDGRKVHLMVHHADELERCLNLRDSLLSEIDCVESYVTEFTPVMGVHTGPGLIAAGFYTE